MSLVHLEQGHIGQFPYESRSMQCIRIWATNSETIIRNNGYLFQTRHPF